MRPLDAPSSLLRGLCVYVGSSLDRPLQARGMTVVTGVLRAGVLRGGRSDAGGGLVGIAVGHKGKIGVGKLFWITHEPSRDGPACDLSTLLHASVFSFPWLLLEIRHVMLLFRS